jgi:hypothetical protein
MKEDAMNNNFEAEKMIRVNCEQFAEILHELDRPGTPGAALREGALAHAETCDDCGALVTKSESLDFCLGQIAQQTAELQAPPRIEAALLRQFRGERSASSSRRLRRQLAALGAAAAALLALGLSFHRPRAWAPDKAPALSASAATPASSPKTKPSPDSRSSSAPAILNVQPKTARAPAPEEKTAATENDATEYATAYVLLPYAYDPSDFEGGAVVRVVLPRAALVSYGLPVEAMGVSDQVTADMVVSEDGTPQAIRLVTQANPTTDD